MTRGRKSTLTGLAAVGAGVGSALVSARLVELVRRAAARARRPSPRRGAAFGATGRQRSQEALRENEEFTRDFLDNANDLIQSVSPEGRFLYTNRAWRRALGYGEEEIPGLSVFDVVAPESRAHCEEVFGRVISGESVGEIEAVFVGKDGRRVTVSGSSSVRVENGSPVSTRGIFRDVTGRRQTEDALRDSEERFRTAFEDAPVGVALTDLDRRYLRANRALCEMLGYPEDELLGRSSAEFTHPEDLAASAARARRALEEGAGSQTIEKRYVCADGSVVWTTSSVSLVRDTEGNPSHFVALYLDVTDSKQVEWRLKEAERRYRMLVERVPAVVYLDGVNEENPAIYRSAHVEEMLGYVPEEFLSDPEFWHRLLHPEDRERVLGENARTNETGEPFKIEYRMIHRDGREVWVRDEAILIRDAEGRPLHWQGVFMDITERREAEARIRFQAQLLEQVQAGIIATDVEGRVIHWNRHAERMYGFSRGEALGRAPEDLVVGPTEMERAGKILDRLKDGGSWKGEFTLQRKDGSTFPAHVSDSAVRDAEGRVIGFVGVSTDLTERKRAEETLRESEERYRAVFERTTDGIFLADFDSLRILETNAALRNMLGYTREQISGMHIDDFIWDSRENIERNARRVLDESSLFLGERRYRRGDGSLLQVECSVTKIPYAGREVSCCIVRDITVRKRAEEEMREANRRLEELAVLKADFTAMVAHELDTPLAVIRGHAEVMSTGELEAEEAGSALARIQAETDVLNSLVEDVRTAANVEREDFAVEPAPVPVRDLLQDAAALAGSLPGGHELVIHADDDGLVRADRHRIGQVLRNLISNAAKYSPDGAPVKLRILPGAPGRVRFEIVDRGAGVNPEDVARIFEKFGRGRGRGGRQEAGLGLGLYLSRRILQAHGTDLTVDAPPGDGSVFGFELDVTEVTR